jgi:hypothetical protein
VQYFANRLVGGDAAGHDQRRRCTILRAEQAQAGAQAVKHHIDNCLLERRA